MRVLLMLMLLPLCVQAAEHEHEAQPAMAMAIHEHGGAMDSLLMLDRFERQWRDTEDAWQWQGSWWYGSDIDKLWLKSEGSWLHEQHDVENSDTQLLYSRAVAPFWDLQAGMRYSEDNGVSRQWAVIGVQGMAPYWFHIDAALFAGDGGLWQGRVETSYLLRLTQQWMLEPRLQLRYAFNEDVRAAVGRGTFDSNIGLRLRYEVTREFAPYVGVERDIGGGHKTDETRAMIGVRFWY